jgi:hypothetical protein
MRTSHLFAFAFGPNEVEQRPEGYSPSGLRLLSPVRRELGYSKRDVELSGSLLVCGV